MNKEEKGGTQIDWLIEGITTAYVAKDTQSFGVDVLHTDGAVDEEAARQDEVIDVWRRHFDESADSQRTLSKLHTETFIVVSTYLSGTSVPTLVPLERTKWCGVPYRPHQVNYPSWTESIPTHQLHNI